MATATETATAAAKGQEKEKEGGALEQRKEDEETTTSGCLERADFFSFSLPPLLSTTQRKTINNIVSTYSLVNQGCGIYIVPIIQLHINHSINQLVNQYISK